MDALNIEIKAQCSHPDRIKAILNEKGARFVGTDHQVDTYYKVPEGRLKLRQGNIENALIYYIRGNQAGPKTSHIKLFKTTSGEELQDLLTTALGVLTLVDKSREIYFIKNVKFHIDQVQGLGSFVEIEAIDDSGTYSLEELQYQCDRYLELFEIQPNQLVAVSYSDLLLNQKSQQPL